MKNNRGITMVSLVVTVIILIILAGVSLNLTIGKDGIITMAKKAKENIEFSRIEEEGKLNELYTQIGSEGGISGGLSYDAIAKLVDFKKAIADYIEEAGGNRPEDTGEKEEFGDNIKGILKEVTKDATATDKDILVGKTAWGDGIKVTGSMVNQGAVNQTLNAGGSYTIPEGYHNGEGKITVDSLTNQTDATATAGEILDGKTAWVKGDKLTGSMPNRGNLNWNPNSSTSYTVPEGYYSGGTISTANAYNAGYNAGYAKAATITYNVINNGGGYMFYYLPKGAKKITITYNNKQYVLLNGSSVGSGSGTVTKNLNASTSYYFQIAGDGSSASGTIYL